MNDLKQINKILKKDGEFLSKMGLMDYSLLLVIESAKKGDRFLPTIRGNRISRNMFLSKDRQIIYHIGIIDYLQNWNYIKKIENIYKTKVLGRDPTQIAAVSNQEYANRFLGFMNSRAFLVQSNELTKWKDSDALEE